MLFLGGTEISKVGTAAATTRRTFSTPGGTPVAVQVSDGSDAGTDPDWTWTFADPQGTVRMSKNAGTGATQHHTYLPFGDPISDPDLLPAGHGFLDKVHDSTGDVRLDHRSYNPTLDTLTTPDPLLDPSDPQNLNAYAYARNNPITFGDPSGLINPYPAAPCYTCNGNVNGHPKDGSSNPDNLEPYTGEPYDAPPELHGPIKDVVQDIEEEGGPEAVKNYLDQHLLYSYAGEDPNYEELNAYYCARFNPSACTITLGDVIDLALTIGSVVPAIRASDMIAASIDRAVVRALERQAAKSVDEVAQVGDTVLYQKLSSTGEHLKYGFTKNPATRYTSKELNGGSLNILARGAKQDMLALERSLHEWLPFGPEEGQLFYIQKQIANGLRPPPYPW